MTTTTSTNSEEIAVEIPRVIRVYKDGRVERLLVRPFAPPSLNDPKTGVSSKDIVISQDRNLFARIYLQNSTLLSTSNNLTCQKVPILVYYHGGTFMVESAFNSLFHHYITTLLSVVNVLVVSVNYKKAPEYPLPIGYNDCWAALQWVGSHLTDNLTNPDPWIVKHGNFTKIFVAGDSSGGNMAHNVAMRAGSETLPGDAKLFGVFLAEPVFGSKPVESGSENVQQGKVPCSVWEFVYPSAPGGVDNPMLNPMAPGAPSLAGLGCSKLLVSFAGDDFWKARAILYCEAVRESGWKGELDTFELEGVVHGYHIEHPESEKGVKMLERIASFLLD